MTGIYVRSAAFWYIIDVDFISLAEKSFGKFAFFMSFTLILDQLSLS